MTGLGLIFALVFLSSLFFYRNYFAICVALAVPFNDSAFVNVGGASVSPYYVSLLVVLGLTTIGATTRPGDGGATESSARILSILLFSYACIVGLLGPLLFSNVGVIASRLGLDVQANNLSELSFSVSSLAQILYLLLNLNLIRYLMRIRLDRALVLGIVAAVGVGVATSNALTITIGVPWIHAYFDTSASGSYAGPISSAQRLRGQFSEPSHMGAFAASAAAIALSLAWTSRMPRVRIGMWIAGILAVSCVFFSASSTGIAALFVVCLVAAGACLFVSITGDRYTRSALVSIPLIPVAVYVFYGKLYSTFLQAFVEKSDTPSYANRTFADQAAFHIFDKTYGLGVGIGNNRSSSLFSLVTSTLGVFGSMCFWALMAVALVNSWTHLRPAFWGLLTILAAGVISYPDFSSSLLWLLTAFAVSARASDQADAGRTTADAITGRPASISGSA